VVVDDIVGRPHPLVSGHRHHELAAGLELGRDRRDGSLVVVDMLDHVERGDEVVMAVAHAGESGERCAHDLPAEPLLGDRPRLVVELERVDRPEPPEHVEVVTGAAADLENSGLGGRQGFAADQLGEHLAAGLVPPVPLVELRHLAVDAALHQPKTQWRLKM